MSTPTAITNTSTSSQPPPGPTDQGGAPGAAGAAEVTTVAAIRPKDLSGEHKTFSLLTENNWDSWREDLLLTIDICHLDEYITGTLKCPDVTADAPGHANWKYNDKYTWKVIRDRISDGQKFHTSNCKNAHEMWTNLEAIHQSCGEQTENQLMRELTDMKAKEGDDIVEHLSQIKQLWDKMTLRFPSDLILTPKLFKKFLAYSLPPTWDDYTRQFSRDPAKRDITVPQYIGECIEEFHNRQKRDRDVNSNGNGKGENGNQSAYASSSKLLINCVGQQNQKGPRPKCSRCGRTNHKTEDCYSTSKPKCNFCNKLGHKEKQCRLKKKALKPQTNKEKMVADATSKQPEANIAEVGEEEESLMAMDLEEFPDIEYDLTDTAYDHDMHYASICSNESARMYDWLADTGSTNHIANWRDLFSSYEPTPEATVYGVGGKITSVVGRGTITLIAQYGTRKRVLNLTNVNYIPTNKYNIFALGRWDSCGRKYKASDGKLTLYNRQNAPVLKGQKIASNIYKFRLYTRAMKQMDIQYTFASTEQKQSWETWHRRFGHISYTGLKYIQSKRLVDGFTVDASTSQPDCVACTEAKQSVKPFHKDNQSAHTKKGELTHMDLWGKYDVTSISGHQYYLLLVDDATRYVTVYFLKSKNEASKNVQQYLTHLHVRGTSTHALRVDRGTEFVNKDLQTWCQQRGIDIQLTAPYSPSQNGVAERMNRTLVELARAMITGSKLPEFLWENAVAHAAYVRNRAYTTSISEMTPYQAWFGNKPNVSHLREFGAPVWVL
jgi:hypothetical protein